jgi:hypothetical protein
VMRLRGSTCPHFPTEKSGLAFGLSPTGEPQSSDGHVHQFPALEAAHRCLDDIEHAYQGR